MCADTGGSPKLPLGVLLFIEERGLSINPELADLTGLTSHLVSEKRVSAFPVLKSQVDHHTHPALTGV